MRKFFVVISILFLVGIFFMLGSLMIDQEVVDLPNWSHPQKNDVYEDMFTEKRIKIVEAGPDSVLYYKNVDWALDGKIMLKMSKKELKEDFRRLE